MRPTQIAALMLFVPAVSWSAPYCDPRVNAACYQTWCTSQGGKPVYRGNWGCDMTSSGGGSGGGGSGAELGRQIGGVLGGLIREGLFGNPQQEAERRAAAEEQRRLQEQENQRIANEQARQDEARYQRLRSTLLGFTPAPQLSLMGIRPGGGGLQLLMGEDAERSLNSGLAELTRAAAWSTLAARARTPEDAAMLADAAFQSLIGGKVDLPPPPPDVKGVPVHPLLPEVAPLKKQYLDQRAALPNSMRPVVDAEHRLAQYLRIERQARDFERAALQGARRNQASDAAKEAQRLRENAEAEVLAARAEFERRQYAINGVEQGLRAWLSSLSSAPRKADGYFYLGFEDGSQCFSQNAGPRCDKARAPKEEFDSCLAGYRQGYTAGEKVKHDLLEQAQQWGGRDGSAGTYLITEPRAEGPCRYEYVMAYNRGYFGTAGVLLASAAPVQAVNVPVAPKAAARDMDPEVKRIIDGITSSARRSGWSADKLARLEAALNGLELDTDERYQPERIRQSWTDVLGRASQSDFAREAARGEGPGLYGAGTQVGSQDCAVFAVATAAGQPYGVVAARATQLIREGEWREAGERANPQAVLEKSGLIGGEVIMLVEAFGQAEVVRPLDFARTLQAGRPVMVNVVPDSGNPKKGHQLVLAKTFRRGAETWYEVIDSNAGPMRRLYLSHEELNLMLHEKGIAYRPNPGTTPDLLRAREAAK